MSKELSKKGFSIVEVLVTATIFSLAVVLVFSIYLVSQKFYQKSELEAEILQNGRVILERITREIRQTPEIVTVLPQTQDSPAVEIEFRDGHSPSPFAYEGSGYYYISYFVATGTREVHRQYKVYCFDDCGLCSEFFRWNDSRTQGEETFNAHSCLLEDRIVGEYADSLGFWEAGTVNVSLSLSNFQERIDFTSSIFGRNL